MPRLIPSRLAAACALAFVLLLSTAALAAAKGPVADLRVVGGGGKVLAEDSFGAAKAVSIKTSPKATCFGAGTGGSGKTVSVKGHTALGMLIQASTFTVALKPIQVTDAFSFGLGLCGVGGFATTKTVSWYLKVNHVNPELGGESVKVKTGDEVLWALAAFPYPDELALSAPGKVMPGQPFQVRVFSYDDKGKKKPAAGVTVTGAASPTGADGRATVTLSKPRRLIARHGKDIPSNGEPVCVGGKCPKG
jgi:hypothetical protein